MNITTHPTEYNVGTHTHGILCVDGVQACGQTTCDKITDGESVSDTDPPLLRIRL